MGIYELSEVIAAWENDCSPEAVTAKERKRAYTALHQTHLPRMVQAGVLRYDDEEGTVELTPRSAVFEDYLDPPVTTARQLGWGYEAVLVGVVAGVLSVALALDVAPFTRVMPALYLFGLALVSLGPGVVRTFRSRSPTETDLSTPAPVFDSFDD